MSSGYRKDSVQAQCQWLLPAEEDGEGFRTPIRIKPRGWLTKERLDKVATKSERLRDIEFKEWWNRDIANRMAKEAVEAALTKVGEGRGDPVAAAIKAALPKSRIVWEEGGGRPTKRARGEGCSTEPVSAMEDSV
jgi:hypothetical protein